MDVKPVKRSTIALPALMAVGIALGIAAYLAAVLLVPAWWIGQPTGLDLSDRLAAEAAVRQSIILLGGGALAVVGAIYTHRRHVIDRRTNELQQDSNYTDRYTAAVAQLGSASLTIRMGGIYGLERVARDSAGDRDTVIAVLASFVRSDAARASVELAARPQLGLLRFQAPLDVVAALSVVTRMGQAPADTFTPPWLDLTGSQLGSVTLSPHHVVQGIDFSQVYLRGAKIAFAKFDGSDFSLADLSNASGPKARFVQARMERTRMHTAYFPNADFSRAWMEDAVLTSSLFSDALFVGAVFIGANLSGSMLAGADLKGAIFAGAILYRTNLSGAKNWDADAFETAAAWDSKTVWPEGFTPSTATKGPTEMVSA
jgi:uncharacterized protein YjbI with pentapeptide repeats